VLVKTWSSSALDCVVSIAADASVKELKEKALASMNLIGEDNSITLLLDGRRLPNGSRLNFYSITDARCESSSSFVY